MKKILSIILLVLTVVVSCTNLNGRETRPIQKRNTFYYQNGTECCNFKYKFIYMNGHKYILTISDYRSGLCHSADCEMRDMKRLLNEKR